MIKAHLPHQANFHAFKCALYRCPTEYGVGTAVEVGTMTWMTTDRVHYDNCYVSDDPIIDDVCEPGI